MLHFGSALGRQNRAGTIILQIGEGEGGGGDGGGHQP